MTPETLRAFKQFLADEWGIGVEEISDEQVLKHYRKRWGIPAFVALVVFALYFWLQLTERRLIAEAIVVVVVGVVAVLSLLVMRSASPSSPGRMRRTKEVMIEVARLNTGRTADLGTISLGDAQQFSQLEWRSLVSRTLLAATLVNVVGRLLGTHLLADMLTLLFAGVIGVLAGWKLFPH